MPFNLNIIPIALSVATAVGIMTHDTQLDQAASVAMITPAALATYAAADVGFKSNEHVHVDKFAVQRQFGAVRMLSNKIAPREDVRRYTHAKKLIYSSNDVSLWPSV